MPKPRKPKYKTGRYGLFADVGLEKRRTDVARMFYEEHKPVKDIALDMGVTPATIYNDLAIIRDEMYESRLADINGWVKQQLAALQLIEEEAVDAWYRSIGKSEKVQVKKDGSGVPFEETRTTETLVGDPRYLDRMLNVIQTRNKLLGLDKPDVLIVDTMESKIIELIRDGKVTFTSLISEVGEDGAREYFNKAGVRVPKIIENNNTE